jgi:hypothetical protein
MNVDEETEAIAFGISKVVPSKVKKINLTQILTNKPKQNANRITIINFEVGTLVQTQH